jgi:hypothetical protein
MAIPTSCCIKPEPRCNTNEEDQVFQDGCVAKMIQLLRDIGLLLGILAIAIGVVEVRTHSAGYQASRITGLFLVYTD